MAGLQNPLITIPPWPMPETMAIIGAGTIGPDIGYYLKSAIPDLQLVLVDVAPEALEKAGARLEAYVRKGLDRGKLAPAVAERIFENLVLTTDYGAIAAADWVIEAATENLELKWRIFDQVESLVRDHTLITSNTSSLPAARLFNHLERPGRATVTHFFAPAWRNPIVEVVDWELSRPEVIAYLRWVFCMTGKVPLVTRDVVCFMLDRVFDNWCNEAGLLLEHATPAEVDSVAQEFVAAGPFFVLNLAHGNPIIVETNSLQADEEGEHYRPADVFKSTDDWDTVPPGQSVEVDADTHAAIRDRLLGVLYSQTVDILDQAIGEPADLDLGCRLALGFRQGPLQLMHEQGKAEVQRVLNRFTLERPGMPTAKRAIASYHDKLRYLLVDEIRDVKVITIRRPEALNALHDELNDEILRVLKTETDAAGFVITGYGSRAFSAGADIGRFPEVLGDAEAAVAYARACSRLLVYLDEIERPVVAALNGMALGGGLELAMRCRSLVAMHHEWMQFPEITLGIVPGIGGMVVPYRRWPQAAEVFHGMLREGRKLNTRTAHELGIVDALAPDYPELIRIAVDRVHHFAERGRTGLDGVVEIAALGPGSCQAANGQILSREVLEILAGAVRDAAACDRYAEALETGYRAFGASACTAAAREGIEAFLNNRKPDFEKTG